MSQAFGDVSGFEKQTWPLDLYFLCKKQCPISFLESHHSLSTRTQQRSDMEWCFLPLDALGSRHLHLQQIQTSSCALSHGEQQPIELVMFVFSWIYFLREKTMRREKKKVKCRMTTGWHRPSSMLLCIEITRPIPLQQYWNLHHKQPHWWRGSILHLLWSTSLV